jgi:hypothetical protein
MRIFVMFPVVTKMITAEERPQDAIIVAAGTVVIPEWLPEFPMRQVCSKIE